MTAGRNWAGNLRYRADALHEPSTLEELQAIVRGSSRLRILGSRHSFSDLADTTGDLVSLGGMPRVFELDADAGTLTVDGAVRYGELCERLHDAGWALHNLASLPHISVAGACATATHGSGDRSANLSSAVHAVRIVAADGTIHDLRRGEPGFGGAVVSLGALGAVVRVTLAVEPTYDVRQDVYQALPLPVALDRFDDLTAAADMVSLFTLWDGSFHQIWLKRRVGVDAAEAAPADLFGAERATRQLHPIPGMPEEACTAQLGVPGPWHERIAHFRMDHTPSAGDELQSEYLVPRRHAVEALRAIDAIRDRVAPLVQVSEIRTVASDDQWMSMASGGPHVGIHFTWVPDTDAVTAAMRSVETVLAPFEPRPHWGKLSTIPGDEVRSRYPHVQEFVALAERFDPDGKLRNDYLARTVFPSA